VPRTDAPLPPPAAAPRRSTAPPSNVVAALDEVVRLPRDGKQPGGGPGDLLVAVVHTVDTVRLVVASTCREELVRRLAGHAWRCGPDELWAEDAARVHALVADGELEAAIGHYFATVGRRWDKEWLVTAKVGAGALADQALALPRSRATGTVYRSTADEQRTAEPRATAPCPPPPVHGGR